MNRGVKIHRPFLTGLSLLVAPALVFITVGLAFGDPVSPPSFDTEMVNRLTQAAPPSAGPQLGTDAGSTAAWLAAGLLLNVVQYNIDLPMVIK